MPNLRLQKRLAASVLKCGKKRIWLDPNEASEIALANSRTHSYNSLGKNIRKLFRNGIIIRRHVHLYSRSRVRRMKESKRKGKQSKNIGRHTGIGKREGTSNARMSFKILWMRRIRILRRLLRKYRAMKRIDKHAYRSFYIIIEDQVFDYMDIGS